ncbi:MAG: amino acid aminotransferase [Pirellulaceae bacterium]
MFENVKSAPPDPVFGIMEAFRNDPKPQKINLTVGAYQDESGTTPIMQCVKQAEQQILRLENTKNYLPIDGSQELAPKIAKLILGNEHPVILEGRFATAHTPGGTGALRIAGDLAKNNCGAQTIWAGTPTWANHPQIYTAAGLKFATYDYLNAERTDLNFGAMKTALANAQSGDAVLLHTVCHNPTGFDLQRDHWGEVFQIMESQGLLPVFDFAYQGFGEDTEIDAWPIREWFQRGHEGLICSSFSKNMGLYGERVGSVTAVVAKTTERAPVLSQIKSIIRTFYSTPPMHGGAIVDVILSDNSLREEWLKELAEVRARIIQIRELFVERLTELAPSADFSHIRRQRGMFSFSGLSREQIIRLRDEYSIYAVENGRINIAGVNRSNLDTICQAIASVI